MKKKLALALVILILPAFIRGAWFYRGTAERPQIATPDFESFTAPQPPVGNAEPDEAKQLGGMVLVDFSHNNRFVMTEIGALSDAVKQRGGKVELNSDSSLLEFQLKSASAYIVISPSILFTPYEIQLVKNFVQQGGRLMVFTDAARNVVYYDFFSDTVSVYGDVDAVNPLLDPFDIVINNDYLYNIQDNEGNFRNVIFDDFAKDELAFGLKQVAFYGTHSVETSSGLLLLRGSESNLSSKTDAHHPSQGGAAVSEDGNVAAFGDFTFLTPPYNAYADNAILIQNLADFALSGNRAPTLGSFPFIFKTNNVQVYLASSARMTNSMITALGSLQSSMRYLGINLEFVSRAPADGDAIIIGSFDFDDEIEPFLKKFDLDLDGDLLSTAEFGSVGRSGNGFLLLDAGKNGNTLVILAGTDDDIVALIGNINYGYLNSCLTQNTIALCSVGYGDNSYEESFDNGEESTPTPQEEPAETETQG